MVVRTTVALVMYHVTTASKLSPAAPPLDRATFGFRLQCIKLVAIKEYHSDHLTNVYNFHSEFDSSYEPLVVLGEKVASYQHRVGSYTSRLGRYLAISQTAK